MATQAYQRLRARAKTQSNWLQGLWNLWTWLRLGLLLGLGAWAIEARATYLGYDSGFEAIVALLSQANVMAGSVLQLLKPL